MLGKNRLIRPSITLSDIFGSEVIYNPRCAYEPYGWVSDDPLAHARTTGGALTVAGSMPVICATGVVTESARRMYDAAGLGDWPTIYPFEDQNEYKRILDWSVAAEKKLVFQQIHPPGAVAEETYWVDRGLLADLNNKACLQQLVPPEYVVPRTILDQRDLSDFVQRNRTYPWVVKGGDPGLGGAGVAVVMLRSASDWGLVQQRLAKSEKIVIERFVEVRDNYCLNYYSHGNTSVFLGGSRQLTDGEGVYLGNWFAADTRLPQAAIDVGHAIMSAAIARGYRGIAGFDMLVDHQDRIWVIDLNFRLNGSTASLMWTDVLWSSEFGCSHAKSFSLVTTVGIHHKLERLEEWIQLKAFLPLTIVLENAEQSQVARLAVRGLVLGQSTHQVRELDKLLTQVFQDPGQTLPTAHVAYARVSTAAGRLGGSTPSLLGQYPVVMP